MRHAKDLLLDLAKPHWPAGWAQDPEIRSALDHLITDLEGSRPSSLPVVRGDSIWWLSVAPTARELRTYLDDLRAWLPRQDAQAVVADVTTAAPASSPFALPLSVLAPEGYVRWTTSFSRALDILSRLGRVHRYLATKPEMAHDRVPSLPALRLEFITALRVGDWARAEACIDEIDHWNLDHASGTIQMRIRLLDARGDTAELFEFVSRTRAWNFASPRRIAGAIVRAIDAHTIEPVELRDGQQAAFELFRSVWYPKLVQTIANARGEATAARPLAYAAAVDRDRRVLTKLLPDLPPTLASFLEAQLPLPDPPAHPAPSSAVPVLAEPQPTPDEAPTASYWSELHASVREGRTTRARDLIASVDTELLDNPSFLAAAPDALLELLSDPSIESAQGPRLLQQEAVAALIDAFVVAPGFPRVAHLEIYLSLLDGLVAINGAAASDADSQLVLGLTGAVAHLSADACPRCEQVVRGWWGRRPVLQRLGWLLAALDSLASLHPDPHGLAGLYIEGLSLAARKGRMLTTGEAGAWRTIGRRLELSEAEVEQYVGPLCKPQDSETPDVLTGAGFRQIAIVSLRETSAREAARELEHRTGASVSIVSSLVAGPETRQAANADLILYVWAATSHATYRAFDNFRDRLEYVQGTGASSIVLAAERWAARRVA